MSAWERWTEHQSIQRLWWSLSKDFSDWRAPAALAEYASGCAERSREAEAEDIYRELASYMDDAIPEWRGMTVLRLYGLAWERRL